MALYPPGHGPNTPMNPYKPGTHIPNPKPSVNEPISKKKKKK